MILIQERLKFEKTGVEDKLSVQDSTDPQNWEGLLDWNICMSHLFSTRSLSSLIYNMGLYHLSRKRKGRRDLM